MITTESGLNTKISELLSQQVGQGRQLGCQVSVFLHGESIAEVCAGQMGPDDPRAVQADTLFLSWSTTKGVVAAALHVLVDRGLIDYQAPISSYWPEFAVNGKDSVTVEQAVSHQAGLHALSGPLVLEFVEDWDRALEWIASQAPAWEPGSDSRYHAISWGWIVGGIIEKATGERLAAALRQTISEPLGIETEVFVGVPDGVEERLATLEPGNFNTGEVPVPPDHDFYQAMPPHSTIDWNSMAYRKACLPSANGHFSARAIARLYGTLANGGQIDGVRIVSLQRLPEMYRVVTRAADPVLMGLPVPKSIGFVVGGDWGDGLPASILGPRETAFGHSGAGGSIGFADPEVGLGVGVTLNKMQPAFQDTGPGSVTYEICELIRNKLGIN